MIARGKISSVADNLKYFSGLDHNEIADRLINIGKREVVAK